MSRRTHRYYWQCSQVRSRSSHSSEAQTDSIRDCRIFTFPKLGAKVSQSSIPLSYTPRKMINSPYNKLLYVIESDHRTLSPSAEKKMVDDQVAAGVEIDREVLDLPKEVFGLTRAAAGNWGSCIRIIDPVSVSIPLSPLVVSPADCCHIATGVDDLQTRSGEQRSSFLGRNCPVPLAIGSALPRRRYRRRYDDGAEDVQDRLAQYVQDSRGWKEFGIGSQGSLSPPSFCRVLLRVLFALAPNPLARRTE